MTRFLSSCWDQYIRQGWVKEETDKSYIYDCSAARQKYAANLGTSYIRNVTGARRYLSVRHILRSHMGLSDFALPLAGIDHICGGVPGAIRFSTISFEFAKGQS